MPQKDPQQLFDSLAIRFPTDSITLAQMRRREPELFKRETLMTAGSRPDALATYSLEYTLAIKAFAQRLGMPDPYPSSDRAQIVSVLNDAYREYGLSAGMQQTRQLIRELETAAAQQADRSHGPLR